MTADDNINLLRLFNSAPKDEKNRFIADPRTDAFFQALAKCTPLTPPQLLEVARRLSEERSPASTDLACRLALQAIGNMGHDRRMLEILSKVADQQTSWGLSGRELLAKITKTYQGLSQRWISVGVSPGLVGGGGGGWLVSYALTAPGSGCTYQPPSGPAVTLQPKQSFTYGPVSSFTSQLVDFAYMITATCWNLNPEPFGEPDLCLLIETKTRT